ncbi:hydantoinase/oxoprolinase family protein [Variovorax boronicumulans]
MNTPSEKKQRYRIGVDVGGTFTDLVIASTYGDMRVHKVSTVTSDPAQGVMRAVAQAAEAKGLSIEALLEACDLFVHGTTVATNTLLEKKGAKIGLIVSDGFRDSLEIRRGHRPNPWDHRSPYPQVLVERYLRMPVGGRIEANGDVSRELNKEQLDAIVASLKSEDVEAVAVALYNSYANPAHEHEVAAALRRAGFEWVSVSSDIAPLVGEYERTSTAVLNAYIAPRTVGYLKNLDHQLSRLGLMNKLLLVQSNGGAVSVNQVAERPVTLLLSGPAAGVGAIRQFSLELGFDNILSMEIGGTSCDVIMMNHGEVADTDLLSIDGYDAAIPSVDVHTVGAGGGTIAGVDAGGMLYVGPQGAGAWPGPACYERGGDRPTVTDANLVLGRLAPETYAAGTVQVSLSAARNAIVKHLADPLGITCEEAAVGIIRLMEQKLTQAVQRLSSERGMDPANFALMPGGGAGALHGSSVAASLGCKKVYVPKIAGALCAFGMLHSDMRRDYFKVLFGELKTIDQNLFGQTLSELRERARSSLHEEGFAVNEVELGFSVDLRYTAQQSAITIPLGSDGVDAGQLTEAFEKQHQGLFGHIQAGGTIEVVKVRVCAVGKLAPTARQAQPKVSRIAKPVAKRQVWVDELTGWTEVNIFSGSELEAGDVVEGPAVIDEQTTTILLTAGDRAEVDSYRNLVVSIAA